MTDTTEEEKAPPTGRDRAVAALAVLAAAAALGYSVLTGEELNECPECPVCEEAAPVDPEVPDTEAEAVKADDTDAHTK